MSDPRVCRNCTFTCWLIVMRVMIERSVSYAMFGFSDRKFALHDIAGSSSLTTCPGRVWKISGT